MEELESIALDVKEITKEFGDNPLKFFKDKKICLFKACLETYYPGIRNCLKSILEDLNLDVDTCVDQSCCSGTFLQRNLITRAQFAAINERNIAKINEVADILIVSCNGCYHSLLRGRCFLKTQEVWDKTENILKEFGTKIVVSPKLRVIHVLDFLHLIRETIGDRLKYTLKGKKCAVHYGCHYMNLKLDKANNLEFIAPKHKLEDLITVLDGTVQDYQERNTCCGWGASQNVTHQKEALQITYNKLMSAERAGAEFLITNCPTCLYTLDKFREEMKKLFGDAPNIPVIHINQLIGTLMEYECDQYCTERFSFLIKELNT